MTYALYQAKANGVRSRTQSYPAAPAKAGFQKRPPLHSRRYPADLRRARPLRTRRSSGCRLPPEMEGDAEHEQVGAIVGGDVVATEGELGEGWRHVILDAGQDVEAWRKGGFRTEVAAGNIAHIEAETQTRIGLHLILIPRHPNQRIERQRVHEQVGAGNRSGQAGIAVGRQGLLLDVGGGAVGVDLKAEPIESSVVEVMADLAAIVDVLLEGDLPGIRGVEGGSVDADTGSHIVFRRGKGRSTQNSQAKKSDRPTNQIGR